MTSAIYKPLQNDEIRLITLHAGSITAPLSCSIHPVSLGSYPIYTALSYTWGDETKVRPILIDGHDFDVTHNLFDALHALRCEHSDKTMWIDAIAINQKDVSERNREVLRMRDIYSLAQNVEVWLGQASDDDQAAMELVRKLAAEVEDPEDMLAHGLQHVHIDTWQDFFEACTPATIHALNGLFNRPWWTRVWVVQELSLAKQEKALIVCGASSVPWTSFLIAAYAIEECWFIMNAVMKKEFPDAKLSGFQNGIRMAQCRHVGPGDPKFHLLELLHQHRDCEATNKRDYLYGLLGLSGDGEHLGIVADYDLTPEEVFIDLFMKHVTATGSLDMLCGCRFPRNLSALPTFVPDWSTDQLVPGMCINERYCGGDQFEGSPIAHFEKYASAGSSTAATIFEENGRKLVARGFTFGTIVELGNVDEGMTFDDVETFGRSGEDGQSASNSETFNNWLNMVLNSTHWPAIEKAYDGMQNVLDAFCRVLVGNRNNRMTRPLNLIDSDDNDGSGSRSSKMDEEHPDEASEMDEDNMDIESHGNGSTVPDADDETEHNRMFDPAEMLSMSDDGFRACIQVAWGKRFAILDTGYIGLVPAHTVIDDGAYVLLGCTLPMMLHPQTAIRHQLVGETYFHGVTDGELMNEDREITDVCLE
jgi:hypothetical protein